MPPSLARVATSMHGLHHAFGFFFAYFEHRCHASTGNLHDLF
jgi:hypothetical protein